MKKLNSVEAHLGYWLRFVSNHVSGRFAKLLEGKGFTVAEWVALRTLYAHSECTHAELITILGMTKGAASKVITKLGTKKLAERDMAEGSAKSQVLRLTAKGRAIVPQLVVLADQNEDYFFRHLTKAERAALLKSMKELVEHHQLKQIPTK